LLALYFTVISARYYRRLTLTQLFLRSNTLSLTLAPNTLTGLIVALPFNLRANMAPVDLVELMSFPSVIAAIDGHVHAPFTLASHGVSPRMIPAATAFNTFFPDLLWWCLILRLPD